MRNNQYNLIAQQIESLKEHVSLKLESVEKVVDVRVGALEGRMSHIEGWMKETSDHVGKQGNEITGLQVRSGVIATIASVLTSTLVLLATFWKSRLHP